MNKLRARTIVVGLFGVLLITSSSMYVALRMGALPWPTIFVTILSLSLLKGAKDSSVNEITLAHTMMSSGSMIAGALAFTIPGIWILNPQANFPILSLIGLTLSGAILGILFTYLFKDKLIKEEPFPIGEAAYKTLITSFNKKGGFIYLYTSLALSAIFTFLRDIMNFFPSLLTIYKPKLKMGDVTLWLSPMALAIGSMIGLKYSLLWLLGSIFSAFLFPLITTSMGFFNSYSDSLSFSKELGIGLMVGTGIFVALSSIYSIFKKKKSFFTLRKQDLKYIFPILLAVILILFFTTDLKFYQIILMIILMSFTTYVSGILTGQTGVNPMEIMGIMVLLAISSIAIPSSFAAFSITAVVAVACGLVGDVTNDLKSGYLSKTDSKELIKSESIGAFFGIFVSIFILILLKSVYNGFDNEFLTTPQAKAVSTMVSGLNHQGAFFIGLALAILFSLFKLPVATLGLGVYLPSYIAFSVALGSILSSILIKKTKKEENIKLIASGFLGGESLMGVLTALFMVF